MEQLEGFFRPSSRLPLTGAPPLISTVFPIPKKSTTSVVNDFRPVALTSLVMKAEEGTVKQHIIGVTNPQIDPLQSVYCTSRAIDDDHQVWTPLLNQTEHLNTSARLMMFADFSSAFQPHILALKLSSHVHLVDQLILWLLVVAFSIK